MSPHSQVLITTDLSGQYCSVSVSDLLTGSVLMTYKDGGTVHARNCLDVLSDQFILAAKKDSPVINIWSFQRKGQNLVKMVCPGKVTALSVTPTGDFCVAAVGEKIMVWQISSGDLLAILEKHFQPVTCIRVTHDSSHFVSGGEDGQVLVWSLSQVLTNMNNSALNIDLDMQSACSADEPVHRWSHHNAKITDIYVGYCGLQARVVTCSGDSTTRIYELHSGVLLATIVFETLLWAVVMDAAEFFLFVGGDDGNIYETGLFEKPLGAVQNENRAKFIGHDSSVTCLAISIDGQALVSGSTDKKVKIWHINSHQCMRTLEHHGPITNLKVMTTPSFLVANDLMAKSLPIKTFKRQMIGDSDETEINDRGAVFVKINKDSNGYLGGPFDGIENRDDLIKSVNLDDEQLKSTNVLRGKISKLQRINERIYNYAVDAIFKTS